MSMFSNYKTFGTKYNLTQPSEEYGTVLDYTSPKEVYDSLGNIEGFSWREGDSFILKELSVYYILVPCDSRIYETEEGMPLETSYGSCGQMAYNTITWKCWKCSGKKKDKYIWNECPLEIFNTGDMVVALKIPQAKFTFSILDFRYDCLYSYQTEDLSLNISKNLQPLLVQGNYFLQEKITYPNTNIEKIIKLIPITIYAGDVTVEETPICDLPAAEDAEF